METAKDKSQDLQRSSTEQDGWIETISSLMYQSTDKTHIQTRLTMDKQKALGLKSDPRATGTPVWKRHPSDISPISRIIYGRNGSRHAREHGKIWVNGIV